MRNNFFALLLAASFGCSFVSSTVGSAQSSAAHGIGTALGNKVANDATAGMPKGTRITAGMNPAFLNMYMSVIFAYAFSSGGYEVAPVAYKAGEFTRWTADADEGKKVTLERAYIGDDPKGNQWWKVKWTDEENQTVVLEGLLNPKEKRFVRMRAKFPDETEGKEMPVDEATYYVAPTRLTQESIEGATKGIEKVTVPAGTFKARHVVFGGVDGTHEWWIDTKVPGGTVRQSVKSKGEERHWDLQLSAFGKGARSELDSK